MSGESVPHLRVSTQWVNVGPRCKDAPQHSLAAQALNSGQVDASSPIGD